MNRRESGTSATRVLPNAVATTVPAATSTVSARLQGGTIGDFLAMAKPEITFLVVLSSVAGFALGSQGGLDTFVLAMTLLGVTLTSAGACTLNHYLERDRDRVMKRTAARPIPAGRIAPTHARNVGVLLVAGGLGILCPLVNPLTAVLAAMTVALYLFVYTPMKSRTWMNTLVGTVPGALPVLGGVAAASNAISGWSAWMLFGVLLCWQMPHFLALAWMYRKDYERGGFAMLPSVDRAGNRTATQALLYTVLLTVLSLTLMADPRLGPVYGVTAAIAAVLLLLPAMRFMHDRSNAAARRLLKATVLYIPLIVLALLIDCLV